MKLNKVITLAAVVSIIGFAVFDYFSGAFDSQLAAATPPAYVRDVPANWAADQKKRMLEKEAHIEKHSVAFNHFANGAVSQTDGIPMIILKLLPVVAPEFWGEESNFLSVMGLFHDPRNAGYPFPRGIGFSGLTREDRLADIDYASFTCGGCHIGRVRLDNGEMSYLDGGVNSEFDVIGYRLRIVKSLQKIYDGETNKTKKEQILVATFLKALDSTHKKDPLYFYNDYSHKTRNFDATYEAKQIALFKKDAKNIIEKFAAHQEQAYEGWKVIAKEFYPDIEQRILQGFPGMEDAIGFNAAKAYLGLKENSLTQLFAPLALPNAPGITDIMVIWNQDTRNPRWNEDESNLVNGGGQWNGHIPLPMYKNIAAQITLGFDNVDVGVSAFANQLLDKLPATVYPFDVDINLAKKGQHLFAQNCASCHQPNNGKVYRNIGTHLGRAKIAGTIITVGAQSGFTATDVCGPDTTVIMEGIKQQPCAEYRGVSMKGKDKFAMTPPKVHDGYNALPLVGIWAQAPYLHTGSVPTLYHMLVPADRPDTFIKSRLDYDTQKVGFSWDPEVAINTSRQEGYVFETASSAIIGNYGHDTDIVSEGHTYKLNWEDDIPGAMALIEYLKVL